MDAQIEKIRIGLGLAVLGLILLGLYRIFSPFFTPILWAVVLVLASWPLYQQLLARMPRRPGWAAFFMTVLVALFLTVLVTPLLTTLLSELSTAVNRTNELISADEAKARQMMLHIPLLGPLLERNYDQIRQEGEKFLQSLAQYQSAIFAFATSAARGIFTRIFQLSICLLAMHFLFRYGRRLIRSMRSVAHQIGGPPFIQLFQTVQETVRASVYGTLMTASVQAVLAGIGFALFGAPVPILLGFFTFVVSLIPIGPPLIYLPVALMVGLQERGWPWGLAIALWGVLIVSLADNFIRPYFLTRKTRLPFFPMFIGIFGGITAFGFVGVFVGPVLIAMAQALIVRYFLEPDTEG